MGPLGKWVKGEKGGGWVSDTRIRQYVNMYHATPGSRHVNVLEVGRLGK